MNSRSSFTAILLGLGGSLAVGTAVGAWTWVNAPVVGGAWWPYVRVVVSVLAFAVGMKVTLLLAQACMVIVVALSAQTTANGLEEAYWTEDSDE
jgi:hypothetical protein